MRCSLCIGERGDIAFLRLPYVVLAFIMVISPSLAQQEKIPIDPTVQDELISVTGPQFAIRRTAHFVVAYDTPDEVVDDFISRLEATYASVYRFLSVHEFCYTHAENRLQVLFFSKVSGFRNYARSVSPSLTGAAGFYHPGTNRSAFYDTADMPEMVVVNRRIESLERALKRQIMGRTPFDRRAVVQQLQLLRNKRDQIVASVNQMVVQHEVAHQVFYNSGLHKPGADNPTWVVEGLACLFEPPSGREGAGLGIINQMRLADFRQALAGNRKRIPKAEDFAAALEADRLVSLRTLIGDKSVFDTRRPNVNACYAQAWALMYYLHRHRRDDLSVYLTVLARRPSDRGYTPEQEVMQFEYVFGPIDDNLRSRWLNYILSLQPLRKR